ncbi:MAG TPA: LLM class flavin-dependent oxidoreductase [Euzebyales bacterium]|nr:LLM class flavin-dependent oxidoreductase [Euzebyales bacterium]
MRAAPPGHHEGMDPPRAPLFGLFPSPEADDHAATVRLVTLADELGLDLVGIQDHPYQRRFLDTFVLMADLLARTERIRVFPDVANLPLRGAAMIAKAAASMDVMSGGRFELGLGAGGFWDAIAAMGGPRREPGEAVDALVEAITVIRRLWSGDRGLRVDGRHYRLAGVHSGPTPAHDVGIWLGATGPRMLAVTGRLADGWIPSSPYVPPDELLDRHRILDEAAHDAGREPSDILRLYNINGRITDGPTEKWLVGNKDHWVEQLRELHDDHRIDAFIFWPEGDDHEAQLRAYAEIAAELR